MAHGVPSFTPRQLLDAGRRAEAEGKLDLAHQFYGHLNDLYGHTSEATEGRNGLIRTGAGAPPPQVWQMNGTASSGPALNGKAPMRRGREKRTGHAVQSQDYENYRVGRGLAALLSAAGWLAILAASLAMAVMAAGEFTADAGLATLQSRLRHASAGRGHAGGWGRGAARRPSRPSALRSGERHP